MMPDGETIEILLVDAFCDQAYTGNPAGVVLEAKGLKDADMQRIAKELNASETAFASSVTPDSVELRYFTPACEVNYCGHATVAALAALVWDGRLEMGEQPKTLKLHTRAGALPTELRPHPYYGVEVVQTQAKPLFAKYGYSLDLLSGVLGLESYQLPTGWPLGRAYTGLWALIVPVASVEAMHAAKPDFATLAQLNRKLGCASTHLYTFMGEGQIACRDFSPAVGVNEDPVTGSAGGATVALLVKEKAVKLTPPTTILQIEQGSNMGRPGKIRFEVEHDEQEVHLIRMAGTAVLNLRGKMLRP